jgi:hypothetical protein
MRNLFPDRSLFAYRCQLHKKIFSPILAMQTRNFLSSNIHIFQCFSYVTNFKYMGTNLHIYKYIQIRVFIFCILMNKWLNSFGGPDLDIFGLISFDGSSEM